MFAFIWNISLLDHVSCNTLAMPPKVAHLTSESFHMSNSFLLPPLLRITRPNPNPKATWKLRHINFPFNSTNPTQLAPEPHNLNLSTFNWSVTAVMCHRLSPTSRVIYKHLSSIFLPLVGREERLQQAGSWGVHRWGFTSTFNYASISFVLIEKHGLCKDCSVTKAAW